MKNDSTLIILVLDRSGSMSPIAEQTIAGVNSFIKAQKEIPGDAKFTLVQFDDQFDTIHFMLPMNLVPKLTSARYVPRASTSLLDAIGQTIDKTGKTLATMDEDFRPGRVIFAIMTDGEENSSKEYTQPQINQMIKHQREKYNWEFHFLGAGQDAIKVAASYAIPMQFAMNIQGTAKGIARAFDTYSANIGSSRLSGQSVSYSDMDRLNNSKED
jgi:hypothetical protein